MEEENKEFLSQKEIVRISLEYTKKYYKDDFAIELVPPQKGERVFDFKYPDNSAFIEVKGTSMGTMTVGFRRLTDGEYKKALECLDKGLKYTVHLVVIKDGNSVYQYSIPAENFINSVRQVTEWDIPLRRREIEKWRILKIDT